MDAGDAGAAAVAGVAEAEEEVAAEVPQLLSTPCLPHHPVEERFLECGLTNLHITPANIMVKQTLQWDLLAALVIRKLAARARTSAINQMTWMILFGFKLVYMDIG